MLLELLANVILWVSTTQDAQLKVGCNKVEFHYGGKPTAEDIVVGFYVKGKNYQRMWKYEVPMRVNPIGAILLEPTQFWVEEVKEQGELVLIVKGKKYVFDLTGSRKKLRGCGGTVYTSDLKSDDRKVMPVRIRPSLPSSSS